MTSRLVPKELSAAPGSDGAMLVTRVELVLPGRTIAALKRAGVIAVETGTVRVWTRHGTTIDKALMTEPIETVYAGRDQSISVPAGIRFHIGGRLPWSRAPTAKARGSALFTSCATTARPSPSPP